MIGPRMAAMTKVDMACPCFSGGLTSRTTDWARGTRAAPNTPCMKRKLTICGMLVAMPQRSEAAAKPAIEVSRTGLRPTRSATHGIRGVTMAAATI